jgi:hypothetical protein
MIPCARRCGWTMLTLFAHALQEVSYGYNATPLSVISSPFFFAHGSVWSQFIISPVLFTKEVLVT